MSLRLALFAQQEGQELFLLGDDFMPWMILALGAALVAGNVFALIKPPGSPEAKADAAAERDDLERPPLARTLVMIVIGLLAAGWGLASLLS